MCERALSHLWKCNQGGDLPLTWSCPTKEHLPRDVNTVRDVLVCSHSSNEQPRTALGYVPLYRVNLCYHLTKYFPASIHPTSVISKFYLIKTRYPSKIRDWLINWILDLKSLIVIWVFFHHLRYSNISEKIFKKI